MINKNQYDRINELLVEHENFNTILEKIMFEIQYRPSGKIPLVVGPSGVGKTTLIMKVMEDLNKFVKQNPELEFGPAVWIEARAPETAEFSWKQFYIELLELLGEPLIEKKICLLKAQEKLCENYARGGATPKITIPELRKLTELSIKTRNPIAILIDEIQSIAIKKKSSEEPITNLDVLKSYSNPRPNQPQPMIILFGTYRAHMKLVNTSELSRRIEVFDFRRYKIEEHSSAHFKAIVNMLIADGFPLSKTLLNHSDFFANHTIGCVGIFIDWLKSAIKLAIQKEKKLVDMAVMKETRLSVYQLSGLAREIKQYESTHHSESKFNEYEFFQGKVEKPVVKKSKSIKRKPGEMNPIRLPVGK